MNKKVLIVSLLLFVLSVAGVQIYRYSANPPPLDLLQSNSQTNNFDNKVVKSDEEWKKILSPDQFNILRLGGTEKPFSNPEMLNEKRKGTYVTADCEEPVFRSETKFDSGTGWPSFYAPINESAVALKEENTFGLSRVEVSGSKCGGHLGHVFKDGPQPTGLRYCLNALALKFIPDEIQ